MRLCLCPEIQKEPTFDHVVGYFCAGRLGEASPLTILWPRLFVRPNENRVLGYSVRPTFYDARPLRTMLCRSGPTSVADGHHRAGQSCGRCWPKPGRLQPRVAGWGQVLPAFGHTWSKNGPHRPSECDNNVRPPRETGPPEPPAGAVDASSGLFAPHSVGCTKAWGKWSAKSPVGALAANSHKTWYKQHRALRKSRSCHARRRPVQE